MEASIGIDSLVRGFEDCTLPKSLWTHRAHLSVAVWYLWHYPAEQAVGRIRRGIQRYNASQGNRTGYHETITLAWVAVVRRLLTRSRGRSLEEVLGELLEKYGNKDYLLGYYSREVLFSDEARHHWVAPDRKLIE